MSYICLIHSKMGNNKQGYLNHKLKIVLPYEEYEYYVYRHIRLDTNEVFYIGYGKLNNGYPNRATKKYSRSNIWNEIIKCSNWCSEIIYQSNSIEEILEKEKEFIRLYGMKDEGGTLCNRSTGGSNRGSKLSKLKRDEMSKNFKYYWSEREHHLKGIEKSKSHKKKLSENSYMNSETYCENNGKYYNSLRDCIKDIFGEFKKSYENGIRNNLKKGLPYKGFKIIYKFKQNAK